MNPADVGMIDSRPTWMAVTREMLNDADVMGAYIEYQYSTPTRLLTLRERFSGWRSFTSRAGYTITLRVSWRASLYWLVHPIRNWRRHHPPVYEDDDL